MVSCSRLGGFYVIEVELKFALPPEIRSRLSMKLQGMQARGIVKNSDVYYDTSSYDLLQQAVFARVRNRAQLQVKFNPSAEKVHGQSTERTFPLQLNVGEARAMN